MIHVTKLNKHPVVVNADLIEFVESTPDTLITLTTGRKFMVMESLEDVLARVVSYRGKIRAYAIPVTPLESD